MGDFPEAAVAADVKGVASDGGGADDGVGEVEFAEDFAFGLGGVHDLEDSFFVDEVEVFSSGDRAGGERAFEAELPETFAFGGFGA